MLGIALYLQSSGARGACDERPIQELPAASTAAICLNPNVVADSSEAIPEGAQETDERKAGTKDDGGRLHDVKIFRRTSLSIPRAATWYLQCYEA
jgi:hypothetical protein